ncbi:hypothetical protein Hgul01_02455 [Herpetosiphon gulosus]|uniref:Uncharacterized protein n=1 Tax=Herpetosiphon gulosus TaxID=1973496 RepID=A0ABP9X266_9CHLR
MKDESLTNRFNHVFQALISRIVQLSTLINHGKIPIVLIFFLLHPSYFLG